MTVFTSKYDILRKPPCTTRLTSQRFVGRRITDNKKNGMNLLKMTEN